MSLDDRCDDFLDPIAVAHELDSFLVDFFELTDPTYRRVSTVTWLKASDSAHRKAAVAVFAHLPSAGTANGLANGIRMRHGNEYDDLMLAHARVMLTEACWAGKPAPQIAFA